VIDHLSEVQQRSFRVSIVILTYDISRREKILLDHYVKNYWHTLCLPYMAEPCHETFRNLHWNAASRTRDFEPWPTADGRRRTILPNATESRWQEEGKISHDPTLHMIPNPKIQISKFQKNSKTNVCAHMICVHDLYNFHNQIQNKHGETKMTNQHIDSDICAFVFLWQCLC
jgi:hypothetical protein